MCRAYPLSTGKITQIPDFGDRGCRTQFATEVAHARKMIDNWGGRLLDRIDVMTAPRRIVFHGNQRHSLADLAVLMGLKVVDEASSRLPPPWPRPCAGPYNNRFEGRLVGHFDFTWFVQG